jgi:hypothetical protein
MSHFAKVENGIVIDVIRARQDIVDTEIFGDPKQWIQTSYNTKNGVHYGSDGQPDGGIALRGNYAMIGEVYDAENDVFYKRQPFPSWTLDKTTWSWNAPVPYPTDENNYEWDEATLSWVLAPSPN